MSIVESPLYLFSLTGLVCLAWLLPIRVVPTVLALSSALFLALFSPWSLMVLLGVTIMTGVAAINWHHYRWAIPAAIFSCVLSFILYRLLGVSAVIGADMVVLGMAFYILRAIHLLIEFYTGRCDRLSWRDLLTWLWFLPTLQVGPINRFPEFRRDLARRRWDSELFALGLQRLLFGYTKIIVIGNYLIGIKLLAWVDSFPQETWMYHYMDAVYYGLHLYFMFSGYSEVAIGFALLLGFRVGENFRFPFLAADIGDFWKRWHMSLSSWCRDYIYMPVFSVTRFPALAAVASMLVLGIWHELSLRYLFWGIWHGVGVAVCQSWKKTQMANFFNSGWRHILWNPIARLMTLNFVILSFTFTGVESLDMTLERWEILLRAFGL